MSSPLAPITRIAIAIITRRRPTELARLLASLNDIALPDQCAVEVVVVENDSVPAQLPMQCIWPLRHVLEPIQGIPVARNRALDACANTSDWVLFLDDDETVDPKLLERLVAMQQATAAPIITGPALPRFELGSPTWAERSGAYMPVRHAHGAEISYAFTNNVLFAATLVRGDNAPRFDVRMLYTGGSDREFFARLASLGHRIVWADDAITYEWYPVARASYRWLFQRSYRLGTVAPATEAMRTPTAHDATHSGTLPFPARCALCWRAGRFALRAAFRVAKRLPDPPSALALLSWDLGRTAGLLAAAFGLTYEEYRSR